MDGSRSPHKLNRQKCGSDRAGNRATPIGRNAGSPRCDCLELPALWTAAIAVTAIDLRVFGSIVSSLGEATALVGFGQAAVHGRIVEVDGRQRSASPA
jgi:hypothetical protein